MQPDRLKSFARLALATTVATYLLILVGALVRASGAGLGCPDWPMCYGRWIPPTSVSQLPAGYDPATFNAILTWTEYTNRLLGVSIGFLIIATAVAIPIAILVLLAWLIFKLFTPRPKTPSDDDRAEESVQN
jgi:heme A synthase